MDNEIRTFVYRTGSAAALTRIALQSMKRKFVTAVSSVFILVVAITAILSFPANAGETEKDGDVQQETISQAVVIAETVAVINEPEYSEDGKYTNKPINKAAYRDTVEYDIEEKEEELVLLSIDDEDAAATFIPAENAGASETRNEEVSENAETEQDENDFSSKTEEIAEKVKVIEKPADSPDKLVYKYNRDMILDLDAENLEVLERIVEAEACDQDFYGKMLVANVVINRIYAGFADTVKGVVFQKLGGSVQFAPIKDGTYYTMTVSKETKEAVARVLAGEDYSQGATYFFQRRTTSASKAAWFDNTLEYLFKYGTHEFYKEKRK